MGYQRRTALPVSADGPALVAILDTLGDILDLLDDRLPRPVQPKPEGGGVVRLTEPDPPSPSRLVEPGPPTPAEPATPVAQAPAPPPRHGRGSSAQAWRSWADTVGVRATEDDTRDDIIAACQQAGVLPTT